MSQKDNIEMAQQVYRFFNRGKINEALLFARDDVKITIIPFSQNFHGIAGFRNFMLGFKEAFSDCKISLTSQLVEFDHVINEFTLKGTHDGHLKTPTGEIHPSHKKVNLPVCEVWKLWNGKIASIRSYFDAATLMRQIGLID